MIHLSDRVTVVDFLDAGACVEGVSKFVDKSGVIAGDVISLSGTAKDFYNSYGDGYGDGYGNGNGNGDGNGYGDGYGNGYGYGDGYGNGDGYGDPVA